MRFMDQHKDMAEQTEQQAQEAMGSSAGMGDAAELRLQERYMPRTWSTSLRARS
jgi:hypothetical protein